MRAGRKLAPRRADLGTDVKLLWQSALALLAVSIFVGMVDAQNRLMLSPDVSDTHVDAATLGWITLGVVALALTLFGVGTLSPLERSYARVLSALAAASVACYVLALIAPAFAPVLAGPAAGARMVFGATVLLAVVGLLGWLGMRAAQIRLGVAHLALLGAALALAFVATTDLLQQMQAANPGAAFPSATATAHRVVLVAGYLVLTTMAVVEWRLAPPSDTLPLLGVIQVGLAFGGAVALAAGILLSVAALYPLALAIELAVGAIFVLRFAPRIWMARWLERGGERQLALSAVYLAVYLALLVSMLARLTLKLYASFDAIAPPVATAIEHVMFVGALTNALFGVLCQMTHDRQNVWPAADDILFWGMNVGLLGFALGLALHNNSTLSLLLEGLFTPILGASLLVGVVAYSIRLQMLWLRIQAPVTTRERL